MVCDEGLCGCAFLYINILHILDNFLFTFGYFYFSVFRSIIPDKKSSERPQSFVRRMGE
jgi:hypothetical protein